MLMEDGRARQERVRTIWILASGWLSQEFVIFVRFSVLVMYCSVGFLLSRSSRRHWATGGWLVIPTIHACKSSRFDAALIPASRTHSSTRTGGLRFRPAKQTPHTRNVVTDPDWTYHLCTLQAMEPASKMSIQAAVNLLLSNMQEQRAAQGHLVDGK